MNLNKLAEWYNPLYGIITVIVISVLIIIATFISSFEINERLEKQIESQTCKELVRSTLNLEYTIDEKLHSKAVAKFQDCLSRVYEIEYTEHERLLDYPQYYKEKYDQILFVETFFEDGQKLGESFVVRMK